MNKDENQNQSTNPESQNSPATGDQPAPVAEPASSQPNQTKSHRKLWLATGVVVALVVIALGAFFLWPSNNQQSSKTAAGEPVATDKPMPKPVKQVFINPVNGKTTPISRSDYYVLTVDDGQNYYGKARKINDNYLSLSPVAQLNSGTLSFLSSRIHGPEPVTYFNVAHIAKLEKLKPASKKDAVIVDALKSKAKRPSDAFPSHDINKYLMSGRLHAFFFADGSVYFAKVTTLGGTFLANADAVYTLHTSGNTGESLVLAKPDDYNKRTAKDLLYWQNLTADGHVAKAIAQYEKR